MLEIQGRDFQDFYFLFYFSFIISIVYRSMPSPGV